MLRHQSSVTPPCGVCESEDAMNRLLLTLDHCHCHKQSFTLASGGLYCQQDAWNGTVPSQPGLPSVDLLLPRGLHTRWLRSLHNRPLLLQEAQRTALETFGAVGFLYHCLRNDSPGVPPFTTGDRLPPVVGGLLHRMTGFESLDDAQRRECTRAVLTPRPMRRTHRRAIQFCSPDNSSTRHC